MPDAVSRRRPTAALVWGIAGALLGLWIGYAVVAGATGPSSRPPASAPSGPVAAPTSLTLRALPALHVRRALLKRALANATAVPAPTMAAPAPVVAMSAPAAPAPAATTSAPATTSVPAAPAPSRSSPPPPPATKPQPTVTAQPKRPSGPDFDESAPAGFDNSG